MKSKKLLLVNPSQPGRRGFSAYVNAVFPPLGLGVISALTKKLAPNDWEIELVDGNFDLFKPTQADLVAFTSFTSTMPEAIHIADYYKSENIPTVIGGAHASAVPEEASKYFDAVVVGEAEPVWGDILDDYHRGKLAGIYNAKPADMVTPDRSLFSDKYPRDTIQTTRGCPRKCSYCSVSTVFGDRYRSRPLQETLDDFDNLQRGFFIIDDNFVGFGGARRKRVMEILQYLIDRGNTQHWYCQTEISVAQDPELLCALRDAGCKMLFIGIETEDEAAFLRDTKKRSSIPCKEAISIIHSHKMCVLGSFILGLEDDTAESMRERIAFIHDSRVAAYQVSVMTPLPGTVLFENLKDQLIYSNFPDDWRHYDFVDTPYVPPSFSSPKEFRDEILTCWKNLYSNEAIDRHVRQAFADTNDLVATGFAAQTLATYRGISIERLREEGVGQVDLTG